MNSLVAYLGPDWTYSHLAVLQFQPDASRQVACSTIDDVFAAILSGKADCGLVPLYNSASGLVSDTADSILRRLLGIDTLADQVWWKRPLCISGQLRIQVRHCLVGCGSLSDIRQVISKQQAVDQCRQWLDTNLPRAQLTSSDSSAAALPMLQADNSLAAIASQQAAAAAGIPLITLDIQDDQNNATEFVVVQRDDQKGFLEYETCDKNRSNRVEYWVEERIDDLSDSEWSSPSRQHTEKSGPTWQSDFDFANRHFRFRKVVSTETFTPGESVTLEMDADIDASTGDALPWKKRRLAKKWRLGVA